MSFDRPSRFTAEALAKAGFVGFESARSTFLNRCKGVPSGPGVYVVLRTAGSRPAFLTESRGGWFKGKDPSVSEGTLNSKWVGATGVLYIGKAEALQRRLRQLLDFGNGRPVGHWGGRYLWQLADADQLLIAWRTDPDPRAAESELIDAFVDELGALPYANLVR